MAVFGYACLWSCNSRRVTHVNFPYLFLLHATPSHDSYKIPTAIASWKFPMVIASYLFYYERRHRVTHTKFRLLLHHGNFQWLLRLSVDLNKFLTSEYVRRTTPSRIMHFTIIPHYRPMTNFKRISYALDVSPSIAHCRTMHA